MDIFKNFIAYRKSAEHTIKHNESMLKQISKTPNDNTAIALETITADINALRQDLVERVAKIHRSLQHCTKDRENDESE